MSNLFMPDGIHLTDEFSDFINDLADQGVQLDEIEHEYLVDAYGLTDTEAVLVLREIAERVASRANRWLEDDRDLALTKTYIHDWAYRMMVVDGQMARVFREVRMPVIVDLRVDNPTETASGSDWVEPENLVGKTSKPSLEDEAEADRERIDLVAEVDRKLDGIENELELRGLTPQDALDALEAYTPPSYGMSTTPPLVMLGGDLQSLTRLKQKLSRPLAEALAEDSFTTRHEHREPIAHPGDRNTWGMWREVPYHGTTAKVCPNCNITVNGCVCR